MEHYRYHASHGKVYVQKKDTKTFRYVCNMMLFIGSSNDPKNTVAYIQLFYTYIVRVVLSSDGLHIMYTCECSKSAEYNNELLRLRNIKFFSYPFVFIDNERNVSELFFTMLLRGLSAAAAAAAMVKSSNDQ